MGKLKHKIRARYARKVNHKPSLMRPLALGLYNDICFVVLAFIHVLAWPVHKLGHVITKYARQHPSLRMLHSHAFTCVAIGLMLTIVSYFVERHVQHSPLTSAGVDTLRAAGAAPLWDTLSGLFKVRNDIGKML